MANSQMDRVLRNLRRAALRHDDGELTDRQLLERFLTAREEAAFEMLVRRHGPMVLGVCRRVLVHQHDAEDAFQATFLILVRKAASIIARDTVGNWLYGVAFRTAQKARATAAQRRAKEKVMARPEALEEDVWRELRPVLDQELSRLPDKYREPVVLCDLEGNTRKEAAQRLGWPEGTLSGRLSRARVLLANRLARRGLALSGGAVAVALSSNAASACLPTLLISSTVQAATLVAAGNAVAGAASAPIAALTEGVLKAMFVTKLKIATAVALALGLVGTGFGLYLTHANAQAPAQTIQAPATGAPAQIPAKDEDKKEEKINLPTSAAPVQALVSMDKDKKLVVKLVVQATVMVFPGPGGGPGPNLGPLPQPVGPGAAPIALPGGGGPGGPAIAQGQIQIVTTVHSQTYDLDDVQVLDTKGNKIDKKEVAKLLKEETVAMASQFGQPVDPLHLRVLKEGTLTFILPMPKGINVVPGGPIGGPVPPFTPVPPATVAPGFNPGNVVPGTTPAAPPTGTPPPAKP